MLERTTWPCSSSSHVGLGHADGAAAGGLAPGAARIVHPEGDNSHAVAVAMDVIGDGIARAQRRGEHETHLALLHHVGSAIALAGFRPGVGHQRHAECGAIKVGRLARVAHVELDVVGASERKKVAFFRDWLGDGLGRVPGGG